MAQLGYLTSVSVSHFKALLDPATALSPGELIKIPRNSLHVFAVVTSLELHGKELLASLIPIGEITQGRFQRGVRHYPPPKAPLFPVEWEDFEAIYQIWKKLGYQLGQLVGLHPIEVFFNPSLLFSRHFAIIGQSGSGKSWTVASLVQRIPEPMPHAKVVFLDLQGEYGWRRGDGAEEAAFPEGSYRYLDGRSLELPYWLLTFDELASLLVDPRSEFAPIQRTLLHQLISEFRTREGRRLGIEHPSIDAPLFFDIEQLYEQVKKENERKLDFGKQLGPFYGKLIDLQVRMEGLLRDSRYRFLFRPRRYRSSEALPKLLEELTGIGSRCPITIVGVSDLPFEVRPLVCGSLARLLYEFNYWNPSRGTTPILLVCEEAHNYLSPQTDPRAVRAFERVAKEGRKYGVGLGIVTQRPREVSQTILAQCGTFFCLRLSNPEDQSYVAQLLTGAERHLIDMLPALGPGEGLVVGDAVPMPLRMRFFRPNPPPKSSDADYYLAWRLLPKGVPVELVASKWQKQGN